MLNREERIIRSLETEDYPTSLGFPQKNNINVKYERYSKIETPSPQKEFKMKSGINKYFSEDTLNHEEKTIQTIRLPMLKDGSPEKFHYGQNSKEKDVDNFLNYVDREVRKIDTEVWTPSTKYRNVKLKKIDDFICDTKIRTWKFQSKIVGTQIKNNFGTVILKHQKQMAKVQARNANGTALVFSDVQKVYATSEAFAFLKTDGTVELCGNESFGGRYYPGRYLTNVKSIIPNKYAFCALTIDHKVRCWGDRNFGGKTPMILIPIMKVVATQGAFAALAENNMVITWGNAEYGGAGIDADLSYIQCLVSTPGAFAAKQKSYYKSQPDDEQEVLLWGLEEYFKAAEKKLKKTLKLCD